MQYTEFDIDIAKEVWQEEAHEEGREVGRAEASGRAEGEARGRAKERKLIVDNLRAQGMSDEKISEATGYSINEILPQ